MLSPELVTPHGHDVHDVHTFELPHEDHRPHILLRLESQLLNQPHHVVVLGRGMLYEGQLVGDLTAQRARALANYFDKFPDLIEQIITSGGDGSLLAKRSTHTSYSEAFALEASAALPQGKVKREEISRTTLENFLSIATMLDPDLPVALLVHREQMRRALWLGEFVLDRRLYPIIAEDFGASAEPGLLKPSLELVLLAKEISLLAGIKPGDREAIAERAANYERFKEKAKPLLRFAFGSQDQYR